MKKVFAFVDERIGNEALKSLSLRGFSCVKLPRYSILEEPISSHADMLLFVEDDAVFISGEYAKKNTGTVEIIKSVIGSRKLVITKESQQNAYPYDAFFNGLKMGKKVFIGRGFSAEITEYLQTKGYKIIRVKQGYPACTVLRLNDKNAITADMGMAKALAEEGICVTVIKEGGISLPPYKFGFIGGACGVFDNTVYFLGNIEYHADKDIILSKINSLGMNHLSLSNEELRDLGGIIFAEEEI